MATIQVRVTDEDKAAAESLFRSLGLDLTTAVRAFLKQSIHLHGMPFLLRKRLTENGFTPEFEEEVLQASKEMDGSITFENWDDALKHLDVISQQSIS